MTEEELDNLKQSCAPYYASTETKKLDGDYTVYKTVAQKGIKHVPLGYFSSEERAVQALHDYLIANGMI